MTEQNSTSPAYERVWTEGICGDGAAILRDGVMVPIHEVLRELNRLTTLEQEVTQQLEIERIRLAVCGVVAMSDTSESAAKARDSHLDYWSASADDIARQIDELMQLRAQQSLTPPAEGEVAELAEALRGDLAEPWRGLHGETALTRAAELLERAAMKNPAADAVSALWYIEQTGIDILSQVAQVDVRTGRSPAHALPWPAQGGEVEP